MRAGKVGSNTPRPDAPPGRYRLNSLSLCMIVKDEEQTLGRCLDSVSGVFDEIVIVDTGSTDATKEVAARFGARIADFPWIDDFAAARNFAFAQGTSEYLMWLDADDVFSPSERDKLLALKNTLDPEVDAASMLYHTAFDAAGNVIASNRRLRIVRRSKNFTWAGAVHEDLVAEETFTFVDTDIVVTHRKPDSESGPSRRNLQILENLIAGGQPVRPVDLLNYARELEMHKQFAQAVPYYEQFLATGDGDVDVRVFALHKLASCYYMSGQPDKEWECTLRSFDIDVPRPEFSCRVAERFLARNQFSQAAFWYELALTSQGTPSAWSIDNHAFRTWLPHKQLGLCYYQLSDYRRSLQHNLRAQGYLPDDPDISTNIGVLEDLLQAAGSNGQGAAASRPARARLSTDATVCIPWRATPDRVPAFERACAFWTGHGYRVISADSDPSQPFLCNQARNDAVRQADTDIVIIADGDTIPENIDQIHQALHMVAEGDADVVWPFDTYRHVTNDSIGREDPRDFTVVEEYRHGSPGGIIVAARDAYWSINGYDERFVPGAWAWDDTAFALAAETLLTTRRIPGVVYSFDHEVDNAGHPGRNLDESPNKPRFMLYEFARHQPELMRALIG